MEVLDLNPKRTRWLRSLASLASLLLAHAAYAEVDEIELVRTSAFVLNFARYASWAEPSPVPFGDFTICIFGHNTLGTALQRLEEKQVQGQRIATRVINRVGDAKMCRLLFFPKGTEEILSQDQSPMSTYRVLTITQVSGRGMISLIFQDGHLGFEIDQTRAHRAGIAFSSQLLKLAIEVR